MDTFGDQLRQERKRRNVALDEIARLTKIRIRYLQALEDGQHERLPGIVFAKGYVRAYAETIGADADRLVGAYVAEQRSLGRLETEASQENVLEALAAAVETDKEIAQRRGVAAIVVVILALGAAVAGFWFGVRPMLQTEPELVATVPPTTTFESLAEPAPETDVAGLLGTTPGTEEATVNEADARVARPAQPEPIETGVDVDATERATSTDIVAMPPSEPIVTEVEPAALQAEPEAAPPQAEPEPAPEQPLPQTMVTIDDMSVSEFGVGTGVEQRVLVGEASEFETGTMVVFWNRVIGGEPGRHIRHVWFHEGSVRGMRDLSIGAAHWRTYSKQTLRGDGTWTVEAQDEQGRVLARQTFVATGRKL